MPGSRKSRPKRASKLIKESREKGTICGVFGAHVITPSLFTSRTRGQWLADGAKSLPCGTQFHAWVEDKEGQVIFDPWWDDLYKPIQILHACLDGATCRLPWNTAYEAECWDAMKVLMKNQMSELRKMGGKYRDYWGVGYRAGRCPVNCAIFMRKEENRGKGYRIRVGSLGWKKPDGSIWWQYGNGRTDQFAVG